jgi:hypothetical protein
VWAGIIATIFLGSLFLQSCATRFKFQNSSVVPAAQGSVKVKKDNNRNYAIDIKLRRLAAPERLTPPKELYVVWLVTEKNEAVNIGRIKTSSALFSHLLKSSLSTIASFKPKGFFITAEGGSDIVYPTGVVVLKTGDVNR